MKIDLHNHTLEGSPDSKISAAELCTLNKSIGIDGVGITEHGSFESESAVCNASAATGVTTFQGIECSTSSGHILLYGPSLRSLFRVLEDELLESSFIMSLVEGTPNITAGRLRDAVMQKIGVLNPTTALELIDRAHSLSGCAILAHPFSFIGQDSVSFHSVLKQWAGCEARPTQWDAFLKYVSDQAPELMKVAESADAIETANGLATPLENRLATYLANALSKPQTGGSDTHYAQMVGLCVTLFEQTIRTPEELVKEIREGRVSAAYAFLDQHPDELLGTLRALYRHQQPSR